MAPKIGLFFGSSTGCGEGVGSQIKAIIETAGVAGHRLFALDTGMEKAAP